MKLKDIKGIGSKTEELLNKLNIFTVEDLITYYPYRYNIIKFSNLDEFLDESKYIKATIVDNPKVMYIKRNLNILTFLATDSINNFNVTIFNRAFMRPNLLPNKEVVLYGKYDKLKNTFLASDILFNTDDNRIEPIYRITKGLKRANLSKLILSSLEYNKTITDYIPNYLNDKYNFITIEDSINKIHNPKDINDIKEARLKLIYEEFFLFMLKLNILKKNNKEKPGIKKVLDKTKLDQFINNLPFTPTNDQLKSFNDIYKDMISDKKMNRLIMGDVGSGKTLVAIYAIYLNFLSNYQSAFMAPTEILAKQHYDNLTKMLPDLNIKLLTGKITKKNRDVLLKELKDNDIDLLIGTHALFSDDVTFSNLGLIITDEQHRFGVNQRKNLENKGKNPDVLYLSATPIPRTYALVLYKDMDLSIIKEKPKGRKDILTKVAKEDNIKEVLLHIYDELKKERQIFVVSPLIDNEESELESVIDLKKKYTKAFGAIFNIEIIHGELKPDEKDKIMQNFLNKKIDILISTTVIEVGIDIPNASMMVIYNAERFGLATLHQLRGRVGRGTHDSYCYLISNKDNERLKTMEESNDGFYITEKDFEQRREGDLFGERQSGEAILKIANIKRDITILMQAQKDAEEFIKTKDYKDNPIYKNIV